MVGTLGKAPSPHGLWPFMGRRIGIWSANRAKQSHPVHKGTSARERFTDLRACVETAAKKLSAVRRGGRALEF
jgi:hypothetical protein